MSYMSQETREKGEEAVPESRGLPLKGRPEQAEWQGVVRSCLISENRLGHSRAKSGKAQCVRVRGHRTRSQAGQQLRLHRLECVVQSVSHFCDGVSALLLSHPRMCAISRGCVECNPHLVGSPGSLEPNRVARNCHWYPLVHSLVTRMICCRG